MRRLRHQAGGAATAARKDRSVKASLGFRVTTSKCGLGSPIRWKWTQEGPKLQSRWMPPIENGFDEIWSEQGESRDAADVGLVDLLGGGKLRNGMSAISLSRSAAERWQGSMARASAGAASSYSLF